MKFDEIIAEIKRQRVAHQRVGNERVVLVVGESTLMQLRALAPIHWWYTDIVQSDRSYFMGMRVLSTRDAADDYVGVLCAAPR